MNSVTHQWTNFFLKINSSGAREKVASIFETCLKFSQRKHCTKKLKIVTSQILGHNCNAHKVRASTWHNRHTDKNKSTHRDRNWSRTSNGFLSVKRGARQSTVAQRTGFACRLALARELSRLQTYMNTIQLTRSLLFSWRVYGKITYTDARFALILETCGRRPHLPAVP